MHGEENRHCLSVETNPALKWSEENYGKTSARIASPTIKSRNFQSV